MVKSGVRNWFNVFFTALESGYFKAKNEILFHIIIVIVAVAVIVIVIVVIIVILVIIINTTITIIIIISSCFACFYKKRPGGRHYV